MQVGACRWRRNATKDGSSRRAVVSLVVALVVSTSVVVAIPASGTASAAGFNCAGDGPVYTVQAGDGWYTIAERLRVRSSSLAAANDASINDTIHPGDRLCLPAGADLSGLCEQTATVQSGDGWLRLAERHGVRLSALVAANGTDERSAIHPGEVICLPDGARGASSGASAKAASAGESSTYRTVSGDSWSRIAERAGVSLRSLLAANDASSKDMLLVGRTVRLPAGATISASGESSTYRAVSGDSWSRIAERAGVSLRSLLAANDASLNDVLLVGQQVRLPAGAMNPSSGGSSGSVKLGALPTQEPCWYQDSWGAARSGGRRHAGVDIFTAGGEYIYAVTHGTLTRRKWAQPGNISGNAWWLTADDGTYYFYAHLSDFAPGLKVGSRVTAGQIIGWVGRTGNTTVDHLHFEIHPGGGRAVNPYPILRAAGGACKVGTPYTQPGGWIPD